MHTETFRQAPEFMNIDKYIFQASVVFTHTDPTQTGNYTCEGINRPDHHTYMYVYVPGKSTFLRTQFSIFILANKSWFPVKISSVICMNKVALDAEN